MQTTLVVSDHDPGIDLFQVRRISFDTYLAEFPKKGEGRTRVINLCEPGDYLSKGYYCSLLAEARQHRVLPSVQTLLDLKEAEGGLRLKSLVDLEGKLPPLPEGGGVLELRLYFGWVEQEPWRKFARAVYEQWKVPLLRLRVEPAAQGLQYSIVAESPQDLPERERGLFAARLNETTRQPWRQVKGRAHRWDMAILVDPEEESPPSNAEALRRLVKAAAKTGIHAELITAVQEELIPQFDALFLRATTRIDHATYRLARRAEKEGLVVIDDPRSILRCCNKIFLHDAFSYNDVPAPRTQVVSSNDEDTLSLLEESFDYPMVLKMPESSFSRGVFKVGGREELRCKLSEALESSALMLVQEYLYTDYDWRIGVLGGRPLYACRYYMARNHWQIYNHGAKKNREGGAETMPTFEVPRPVLDVAVRATRIIGDGLYGVDIKQKGKQVYVIEVNDNPNLDHGIEDKALGDELYMQLMQEFANRLEKRGRR